MTSQHQATQNDQIGRRLRAGRERLRLTQAQLAERLGFENRQTLAAIEAGERKVSAAELLRAVAVMGLDLEYFTDSFRLVGEGRFSFRAAGAPPALLDQFEDRAGRWIATYRRLGELTGEVTTPLEPRLSLSKTSSFEEAQSAAEALVRAWELGEAPAHLLEARIRERLGALVLFVDAPAGISGAACQLPGLNAILVNRREPEGRRNYDLAHELFHLLTWDAMPPSRVDSPLPRKGKGNRVEQLAESFGAALLMPEASLASRWHTRGSTEIHRWLNAAASEFLVSALALKWRLHGLGWISRADLLDIVDHRLVANGRPARSQPVPRPFGPEFVARLAEGIDRGHLSLRRAAGLLGLTLEQMDELFGEYEIPTSVGA